MFGTHYLVEAYQCHPTRLDNAPFIEQLLTDTAEIAKATLLRIITHKFEPQGVTGIALLAESHISIHTWPQHEYAAVDVYTCGDQAMPEVACQFLLKQLESKASNYQMYQRFNPSSFV